MAGTAVLLGKEATHGTIASQFTSVPCDFSAKMKQANRVLDEDRQGQDRNFSAVKGVRSEEFSVGDSFVYHDTFGFWLCSALGLPTKVLHASETLVFDNTFKFADDPVSLSAKWQQPRRYTQAYQSLNCCVDKMTIKYSADGDLTYSLSGVGLAETEITQVTHTFSAVKPLQAWMGTVLMGGSAYSVLLSGTITITRNRKPWYTINNTQDANKINIGSRTVDFDFVSDFASKSDYDDFKAMNQKSLKITWTDTATTIGTAANPVFQVQMSSTIYEEAEIDNGSDLPMLKVKGSALYNATDASTAVLMLTSTKDYTL